MLDKAVSPEIYKVQPKKESLPSNIEREFLAAISLHVESAISLSNSKGTCVLHCYLKSDSFSVEYQVSRRFGRMYWGSHSIAGPSVKAKKYVVNNCEPKELAIRTLRKELNDLPPSSHLGAHSSIVIDLTFENGKPKSSSLSRIRSIR